MLQTIRAAVFAVGIDPYNTSATTTVIQREIKRGTIGIDPHNTSTTTTVIQRDIKRVTFDTSIVADAAFTNPTHFGNPSGGCEPDELTVAGAQIGVTGALCSPPCHPDGSCPIDFPVGVTALPQCALTAGVLQYCLLECLFDDQCDTGATCKAATPTQYGICSYDAPPPPPSPPSHYGDPFAGCAADEITVGIQGMSGEVCAPKCAADLSCPTDVPLGVTALPQCALQDGAGNKYCVLECTPGMICGVKASCKSSTWAEICTYDS